MTTRWARVVRGQVVAVIATVVAAFSHGAADGAHPPLAAMALALAFSSIICVFLAVARLSRLRLAASVAISQLLYHGLFSLLGVAGAPTGTMASGHHGTITFVSGPATPGGVIPVTVAAADQWMLLAHLGAAVVTYVMLVRGERALLALGTLTVLLVSALAWQLPPVPAPLPSSARFPTSERTELPHRLLILVSALTHRGPPLPGRFA